MGTATDFVKALLVGRYADPGDASDLTRIETSFHEWIRGNLLRMGLARPADFAAFVTDEFAPHAEAYCTLFRAAQAPDSSTDLHSLFFNNVNGIRSQFQLIFAAVRRGDSTPRIRAKARRVADYLDLLYVRRIISGHSAHPSELDAVIGDLIPKLRDTGDRGQNLLAASLHPGTHKRNPAFSRFLKQHDLASLMRPYPTDFDDKAILTRQDLYRRLCEIIWNPARLGFMIPETRQIPARRTKSANGWDFWQLQTRRERRPLKELRDELIRGER
jgi:hypothetical protein